MNLPWTSSRLFKTSNCRLKSKLLSVGIWTKLGLRDGSEFDVFDRAFTDEEVRAVTVSYVPLKVLFSGLAPPHLLPRLE